jgi:hypothetical protein
MVLRFTLIVSGFIFIGINPLYASDLSDATDMRKRCEAEFQTMEVPMKNFGNNYVRRYYTTAVDLLKDAKIKLAQSQYKKSIAIYNKILLLYKDIYKELSADYIARTEMIHNDTAAELADYIDNKKVSQYFILANQNVVDAKKAAASGNYMLGIETCRASKKYSFAAYTAAGKPIPDKYKKDVKDNNKQLE